jgi:SAM-dependent methyltransferase
MSVTLPKIQGAPEALSVVPRHACAACGAPGGIRVAGMRGAPTNSCLMLPTPEEARAWPRGDIELFFCESCGFISNRAADAALTEYSERYEPTQGWSPSFRRYHRALAERIAAAVPLKGRRVVEVGCGQGEFLHLLCGIAGASGLGFDPCLDTSRRGDVVEERAEGVHLVGEFFAEDSVQGLTADLLICKMTLEHIPAVDHFAALCAQVARQSAPGMRLFIQVPESVRILKGIAFEDIYYEHVNYFTDLSLEALFARHGFRADELFTEYDGQYLGLIATYTGEKPAAPDARKLAELRQLALDFAKGHAARTAEWRRQVAEAGRVVVWGSGSKGVTFLGVLGEGASAVSHVVDINPHRQGMCMVGSGHPIVGPGALAEIRPDTVVLMNRVYVPEVSAMLSELGLQPRLLAL